MDSARDTVGDSDVELGQSVLLVDRGVRHVSDGSSLDNVFDRVSLDGLVLEGLGQH